MMMMMMMNVYVIIAQNGFTWKAVEVFAKLAINWKISVECCSKIT